MTGSGAGRAAQPERTRLAWRRTVLTATAVTLLAARQALLADSPEVRALATALVMLLWLVVLVVAARRIATLDRPETPAALSTTGPTAWLLTGTVIGLATLGTALLWS